MEAAEEIASVKGHVEHELLLRNEYLAAENEILRSRLEGVWSAVQEYIAHHYGERPHQGLGNEVPAGSGQEAPATGRIECRERLVGLLKSYHRVAA